MAVAVLEAGSDKSDAVGRFWWDQVWQGLVSLGRSGMAVWVRLGSVWTGTAVSVRLGSIRRD